jgi:hypothetical protein
VQPLSDDPPTVKDHPITQFIDWESAIRSATVAAPPGDGWEPIVSVVGRPLVAVRDAPARQTWIGFSSPSWTRSSDFVIFWTNVLDWTSGVRDQSRFIGVRAVPIGPPPSIDWPQIFRDLPLSYRAGVEISPILLFASVILAMLGMLLWPRAE